MTTALRLDVVSDVICPWCYIAKARLASAAGEMASRGVTVELTWRAYELNPDMPLEGLDRKDYRTRKFGSWERSRAMDEHVVREGRAEGLDFDYERVRRTPNTRRAHRLTHRALREGGPSRQNRVVDRLFESYFSLGEDVGDPGVLVEIARTCGLDDPDLDRYLRSNEGTDAVIREETLAARAGLRGVPAVLHGDGLLFPGALPAEEIVQALSAVLEEPSSPSGMEATVSGTPPAPESSAGCSIFP